MKSDPAERGESIQWLPAERLGQLDIDEKLRPWLIGKGILSERVKAVCGERFSLRLVDQWSSLLSNSHKLALRTRDNAGMFRDVELCSAGEVWVFAQTVTPDSTLCLHPWLAEMGDTALDETLNGLSGLERSSYEYAWLPGVNPLSGDPSSGHPLTLRALRNAQLKVKGLWARRTRLSLRGAPLVMQEAFLPAVGRV